jgi:hypothetical protein
MPLNPKDLTIGSDKLAQQCQSAFFMWWMANNCTHCRVINASKSLKTPDSYCLVIHCHLKHDIMSCSTCPDRIPRKAEITNTQAQTPKPEGY